MGGVSQDSGRLLFGTDELDDGGHVVSAQSVDRLHIAESPVVCNNAAYDGALEGLVTMVVRGIDEVEERRARFCSHEIDAMTFGAVRLIQVCSFRHQNRVTFGCRRCRFPSAQPNEHHNCGNDDADNDPRNTTRRRGLGTRSALLVCGSATLGSCHLSPPSSTSRRMDR
jgi:hypothetical protein